MDNGEWTFPTLAYVWEYRNGAIMAGAERLDALPVAERQRSLEELSHCVQTMVAALDDGWLMNVGFWMVEDIYKSLFRDFFPTPGVYDYLAATAAVVVEEIARRGFALHYIVDSTQPDTNLAPMLVHLPAVFQAAGLAVIGPQMVAVELLQEAEGQPPANMAAIQRYRDEGYAIANELISTWYREGRSSAYLNLDRQDDTPGFDLEVALSAKDLPRAITVFRNSVPSEGSEAYCFPPAGVSMPPGMPRRPAN